MRNGLFVTGTDTNIGKTVVCAALIQRYRSSTSLCYWKPIQTGIEVDNDTQTVKDLAECGKTEIFDKGIRLPRPLSPHLSAQLANKKIRTSTLVNLMILRYKGIFWVVEGAGGVMVPINEKQTMLDLMVGCDLPVLIVARSSLGTINHTLLTLAALRDKGLKPVGVAMVGEKNSDNRSAIEFYGKVPVVVEMPHFDMLTPKALGEWSKNNFDMDNILKPYLTKNPK
jgi:dethiobiotin synthase